MNVGDIITVRALHADGQWYRRWKTTVESADDTCIVTYSPANSMVEDVGRQPRALSRAIRSHYWLDKLYNLHEGISADGSLAEIYINVASPPKFVAGEMVFIDHELDIVKRAGEPAVILDEDEFESAITKFGYAPEFVARCHAAVEESRLLAEKWR